MAPSWRFLPLVLTPWVVRAGDAVFTNLPPIRVEAPRAAVAWNARADDALDTVPHLSVRRQGRGAQGDLSVRGGAFNTSGLLLQGLAIRNPQTEHFQGDLDLPAAIFETPRIATGLERFSLSSGHPSGAVILDLAPIETAGALSLGGGEAGYRTAQLRQGVAAIPGAPGLALAFFGGADAVNRTDRRPDNDLERRSGGARAQYLLDAGVLDLLLSTAHRAFGARGFYGVPPGQPSEEQVANRLALLSYRRGDRDTASYDRFAAALNSVHDDYWYNGRDAGAPSSHRSSLLALNADISRPLAPSLALRLRGDVTWERIRSRTLGDHQRSAVALAALPAWRTGPWEITVGGAAECFEDDRPGWLPAAGIAFIPSPGHRLQASYSEALRQPSYTELNYSNPTSLGNQGLERQHTRTTEIGWRGTWPAAEAGAGVFAEHAENSVDWLRLTPEDPVFRAVNIESLCRFGATGDLALRAARDLDIRLAGLVQTLSSDTDYHASRYVMDAVRREIRAELLWRIVPDWNLRIWHILQRMDDNPLRHSGRHHRLVGTELQWCPAWARDLCLTAGVSNLLDDDFEPFAGQPEAGRRVYAAAECRW